ncbi:hypothetical protein [Salinibacterium sp. ZJ454]|uniref:hypothetical protein n=1 Tax=Salinibacterium sp. ZJ454 TaxID=2708339 RepID=UPI00142404DF|nr:hypothetical protein [Salinibacterium sp. ZJ454]
MNISRFSVAVVALALLTVVTGCTASRGYPIFDREQTAEDELSAVFDKLELDEFAAATSRFSATHDGVDYYLIKRAGEAAGAECVAIADPEWPLIGCGDFAVVSGQGVGATQIVPAPAQDDEEWTAISDNVRVRADRQRLRRRSTGHAR